MKCPKCSAPMINIEERADYGWYVCTSKPPCFSTGAAGADDCVCCPHYQSTEYHRTCSECPSCRHQGAEIREQMAERESNR